MTRPLNCGAKPLSTAGKNRPLIHSYLPHTVPLRFISALFFSTARRATDGTAADVDIEAWGEGLMACRTLTTLLSSRLVSGEETEAGEGGDEDFELGEEAGGGQAVAATAASRRFSLTHSRIRCFAHCGSGRCSTLRSTRCWWTVIMLPSRGRAWRAGCKWQSGHA